MGSLTRAFAIFPVIIMTILALTISHEEVKGDWGYPGYESLTWTESGDMFFTYDWDVYRYSHDDLRYLKFHDHPANYQISDNEKYLCIEEHYLPEYEYDYPLDFFVYDLRTGVKVLELVNVKGCSISPEEDLMIAMVETNLKLYDLETMRLLYSHDLGKKHRLFPDGVSWEKGLVVIQRNHSDLTIFDIDSGREIRNMTGYSDGFDFSPDGSFLQTYDNDVHRNMIWDTSTWQMVFETEGGVPEDPWGPSGETFIFRTTRSNEPRDRNRTYHFISTTDWKENDTLDVMEFHLCTMGWNDEKSKFSIMYYSTMDMYFSVRIYDYPELDLTNEFETYAFATTVCFSPDNDHIGIGGGWSHPDIQIDFLDIKNEDGSDGQDGEKDDDTPFVNVLTILLVTVIFSFFSKRRS